MPQSSEYDRVDLCLITRSSTAESHLGPDWSPLLACPASALGSWRSPTRATRFKSLPRGALRPLWAALEVRAVSPAGGLGLVRERFLRRAAPRRADFWTASSRAALCPETAMNLRSTPISGVSSGTATRARAPPWLPKAIHPHTNWSGPLNPDQGRSACSSTAAFAVVGNGFVVFTSSVSTRTASLSTCGCSSTALAAATRPNFPSSSAFPYPGSAGPTSGHTRLTTGNGRRLQPATAHC